MDNLQFGVLEDKLAELLTARKLDYEVIERCIREGANVNATDKNGESILQDVCLFGHEESVLEVIQRMIAEGCDVKKYGLSSMLSLVFSSYDRNVFHVAKLLLEAGASGDKEKWENLLEAISTEESYQRCCEENHERENIFYAFYELAEHAYEQKQYSDIELWEEFVGEKVMGVFSFCTDGLGIRNMGSGKYSIGHKLLIHSEKKVLIVEGSPNVIVRSNPHPYVDMQECEPVEQLKCILGATVTKFTFKHAEVEKEDGTYRQPIIILTFDNDVEVRFSTNFGEVDYDDTIIYFEIV